MLVNGFARSNKNIKRFNAIGATNSLQDLLRSGPHTQAKITTPAPTSNPGKHTGASCNSLTRAAWDMQDGDSGLVDHKPQNRDNTVAGGVTETPLPPPPGRRAATRKTLHKGLHTRDTPPPPPPNRPLWNWPRPEPAQNTPEKSS